MTHLCGKSPKASLTVKRAWVATAVALVATLGCGAGGAGTTANSAGTGAAIAAPAAPTISSFSAGQTMVASGCSTVLTGIFANGTGVITPGRLSATSDTGVTVTPTGSTTYTLTVTNETGAQATQTISITLAEPPNAVATTAPSFATASATGLMASLPAQAGCTYAWTISGGTITGGANTNQVSFTAGTPGQIQLACMITASDGLSLIQTASVTVIPAPTAPVITTAGTVNAGASGLTASIPAQAGCTFAWAVTGGSITGGGATNQLSFQAGPAGLMQLACTVTNAAGTSATQTANLTAVPIPSTPTITAPATVTAGALGLVAVVRPQMGCTYAWTISGGTISAGGSSNQVTFTAGNGTSMQLGCTVTNAASTSLTALIPLAIVAPPVITSFGSAQTNVAMNASAGTTLTAVFANGQGSINRGLGPVQSASGLVTGPVRTTMTYTLTVTNAAGTSTTASTTVYGPSLVATGDQHVLAVKGDGTVWAWGNNTYNQLGDGTCVSRDEPAQVPGLGAIVSVAAGTDRSFALKSDGTVWTWGYDYPGNGTLGPTPTPIQVPELSGILALSVGLYHNLALKSDGTVWAWGWNPDGRLGDGTTVERLSPVQVSGLNNVVAVVAEQQYSSALTADGSLWVWGESVGAPRTGTLTPVKVSGISNSAALAGCGDNPLVLESDGSVWATTMAPPAQVAGLGRTVDLATGLSYSLALMEDGTVWGWGNWLIDGQIGVSPWAQNTPIQVAGLSGVLALVASSHHSFGLVSDGTILAWGDNLGGILGDDVPTIRNAPVAGPSGPWQRLVGGMDHTLGLKTDGSVWSWGSGDGGELGNSTDIRSSQPGKVLGISGLVDIGTTVGGSLAVDSDGSVWIWGQTYGFLPVGANDLVPVQVPGLAKVAAIASGSSHIAALLQDGTVSAWGSNAFGALGNGTTVDCVTPIQVPGLTDVKALSAGLDNFTLALKTDGTVCAWGCNDRGQLGDGTRTHRLSPVSLPLTGISALSAGSNHCLALGASGEVWAWGENACGEIGNGCTGTQLTPYEIAGLTGITSVVGGAGFSLALKSDGTVWSWGLNDKGQLGDGTYTNRLAPVQVPGLSGVTAIGVGVSHSMALTATGSYVWGSDSNGQLGLGRLLFSPTPLKIHSFNLW